MKVPQGENALFIGKYHEIRHSCRRSIRQGARAALEGAQGSNRARLPHAVEFPVYWHSENPAPTLFDRPSIPLKRFVSPSPARCLSLFWHKFPMPHLALYCPHKAKLRRVPGHPVIGTIAWSGANVKIKSDAVLMV